jgi:hypothetical protein
LIIDIEQHRGKKRGEEEESKYQHSHRKKVRGRRRRRMIMARNKSHKFAYLKKKLIYSPPRVVIKIIICRCNKIKAFSCHIDG